MLNIVKPALPDSIPCVKTAGGASAATQLYAYSCEPSASTGVARQAKIDVFEELVAASQLLYEVGGETNQIAAVTREALDDEGSVADVFCCSKIEGTVKMVYVWIKT